MQLNPNYLIIKQGMRVHHKLEVKKISKIIDNGSDIKIVYTTDVLMKYRMIIHIPNTTSCEEFRGHARSLFSTRYKLEKNSFRIELMAALGDIESSEVSSQSSVYVSSNEDEESVLYGDDVSDRDNEDVENRLRTLTSAAKLGTREGLANLL